MGKVRFPEMTTTSVNRGDVMVESARPRVKGTEEVIPMATILIVFSDLFRDRSKHWGDGRTGKMLMSACTVSRKIAYNAGYTGRSSGFPDFPHRHPAEAAPRTFPRDPSGEIGFPQIG